MRTKLGELISERTWLQLLALRQRLRAERQCDAVASSVQAWHRGR